MTSKTIKLTIEYRIQEASKKICEEFGKPPGILEVLDSDNTRRFFATTEKEAVKTLKEWMEQELGFSGGFYINPIIIDVVNNS